MAIKKFINTTEAAELTGRPYNEILNLAKTGVLPSHKTHRGHYRLNVDAVEEYFGIQINKSAEEVAKPVPKVKPRAAKEPVTKPTPKTISTPVFNSPQAGIEVSYVADEEHYTEVFKRMTEVKSSLKIATGDLKNFYVSVEAAGEEEKIRLCDFFLSLVERGVHVQVVPPVARAPTFRVTSQKALPYENIHF